MVIGGGLAGCASALELADNGFDVTIIEKGAAIGGKVRNYGCKATDSCNNCGVCLSGGLWDRVENNKRIKVLTGSQLMDVSGNFKEYEACISDGVKMYTQAGIWAFIISIGFDAFFSLSAGSLEFENSDNIISGSHLENLLADRKRDAVFSWNPKNIAFIQCFGSRDVHEKAGYCSRVCCGYSTRSARVLRKYYPDAGITFFYMDLQQVENGDYFRALNGEGMEFVRCRPVKVKRGSPVKVLYENPGTHSLIEREFDLVILSEGVHPPKDADRIAEICYLGIDGNGFLKKAGNSEDDEKGIYLAGCVTGPRRIEETYNDALAAARNIINTVELENMP